MSTVMGIGKNGWGGILGGETEILPMIQRRRSLHEKVDNWPQMDVDVRM